MQAVKILFAVVALTFAGCGGDLLHGHISHDDITNIHEFDVNTFRNKVANALHKAELSVLGTKPDKPDDKPLGPDEDPNKCVCGGTGIIRHGDGHTTKCPYHTGRGGYGSSGGKSTNPKLTPLEVDGKILFYKGE